MSIGEFSEVLKQQEQVLDVTVPAMAVLGVVYLVMAGGYLAVQKVRKKIVDETDKKRVVVVVSVMSTLLLAVAAALVISIMQRMNRVIQTFRGSASSWAESVGTESAQSQLLILDSQYTVLFWGSAALAAVLIAACFFLVQRAKRTYVDLRREKPLVRSVKGIIAVTSSIVPEYDEEDDSVEEDMV